MTLPTDPEQWVDRLAEMSETQASDLEMYGRYYDLTQPLSYMHPDLWLQVAQRIRPVLIAWPQLVVDSVNERLCVEGFRWNSGAKDDAELWDWWQANNLDEGSQQAHLEALICGRGYVIVGIDPDDRTLPRITVESPLQVTADFDPQTRKVRAALKQWSDDTDLFVTLYLPNATYRYARAGNGGLELLGTNEHNMGVVPVVPFVNRARVLRMDSNRKMAPPGRSELAPILPLVDSACKLATDMMVGAESIAIPSRYIFGLSKDEFYDESGNAISQWKQVMGKMFAHEDKEIVAGQWPAASLDNFHNSINQLAQMVAAVSALPPHYLGFTTDNPASADAIRSNEIRLVKHAEIKQTSFGESWESTCAIAYRIVHGEWNEDSRRLETHWRDAATPTIGQVADAKQKLVEARIIPYQQAREDLAYTQGQLDNMEAWDKENAAAEAAALAALPSPTSMVTEKVPATT